MAVFPNPNQLDSIAPAEILDSLARGHLAPDHRALRSLMARPEQTVSAILDFAKQDRTDDIVDLEPEFVGLIRQLRDSRGLPLLIDLLRRDPQDVPDGLIEALVSFGAAAVDPVLELYRNLEEEESGEVAFILANLGVKDPRIRKVLTERLVFDAGDGAFLLGLYGDVAALPDLEKLLGELPPDDPSLRKEVAEAIDQLRATAAAPASPDQDAFDLLADYPETELLPVELLTENERIQLLDHPLPEVREKAVESFFNRELEPEVKRKLLGLARSDTSAGVRAHAWQTLMDATDDPEVVEGMLAVIRNPSSPLEERCGAVIGLALEVDRNEVRSAMLQLYEIPSVRAKALEAMWRSIHPGFRDYFPKHLTDEDLEVRRAAIWGVGYHGIRSELDRLRTFFDDEELRADAIFAYALTIPGDLSPSRMKKLMERVEKDANGLSEEEENLVMAALDERLALAGKQPYFAGRDD